MDIEDMWLPFFFISANLTRGEMKVHSSGNAALSVIASARAPGLFPPVTWDNELLVDGGTCESGPIGHDAGVRWPGYGGVSRCLGSCRVRRGRFRPVIHWMGRVCDGGSGSLPEFRGFPGCSIC